ncbi:MAG: thiol:disulfide interchange protein DsbA/DsbL [Gammaproteobacteria bacterium]|nr:thiol:disulfide interchange protein DsbA/DsbL [Gammaproteobacteria bacterium]
MDFIKYLKWGLGLSLLGLLAYAFFVVFFKPADVLKADVSIKPASHVSDKGYEVLPVAITSNPTIQALIAEDPGRVQLVNFFSYACYGCMRWHPFLDTWAKQHAQKVTVHQVPILFNKAWEPFARIYFIVKALKRNDALDTKLFETIQARSLDLTDKKNLADFFKKNGVPPQTVEDLYDSFSVNQDLLKAKNMAAAYQITLSPSVVLNTPRGSYLITPNMIEKGSGEGLMQTLDALLASLGGSESHVK